MIMRIIKCIEKNVGNYVLLIFDIREEKIQRKIDIYVNRKVLKIYSD